MSKLNFSTGEDDLLIEAVADYPALYDLNHQLFKDQRAKDDMWLMVAEKVGRLAGDCKKRWKNIKDTYDRKIREYNKSGSAALPHKKGKQWVLEEKLSFLRSSQSSRREFCRTKKETLHADGSREDTVETHASSLLQEKLSPVTDEPENESEHLSNWLQPKESGGKRKLHHKGKLFRTEKREKVRDTMWTKEEDMDDVSPFFKSIATTVKKFPPHLQQRAKLETLSLISNIESEMWSSCPGSSGSGPNNRW